MDQPHLAPVLPAEYLASDSDHSFSKESLITALGPWEKKAEMGAQSLLWTFYGIHFLSHPQTLSPSRPGPGPHPITSGHSVWYRVRLVRRQTRIHTELWVSNNRKHLTCARVREAPKGRALELDLCPPIFMSMEVNEGLRQGPVLQSHTYLDPSPCCVIWDKLLNLSEPRDL